MALLSPDTAQEYYQKLLAKHQENEDLPIKVNTFHQWLTLFILPEITGLGKGDDYNQRQWLWDNALLLDNYGNKKSGFVPKKISSGIVHLFEMRNYAYHKGEMTYAAYLGHMNTLADTISFFSEKKIPDALQRVIDGDHGAEPPEQKKADKKGKNQKQQPAPPEQKKADKKEKSQKTAARAGDTYMLSVNYVQTGPFSMEQVKQKLLNREITPDYYICPSGIQMNNWIKIGDLPEFESAKAKDAAVEIAKAVAERIKAEAERAKAEAERIKAETAAAEKAVAERAAAESAVAADFSKGQLVRTFEGHSRYVTSVAFSPDGENIVSGSLDNTVKLWDAASGRLVRTSEGHENTVSSVTFSRDGRYIVSGSDDKTVKLWETTSGWLVRTFEERYGSVSSVAISPNGKRIISGALSHVTVWKVASGRLFHTFNHFHNINSVAFSPDGHYIVSGSDGTVILTVGVDGSRTYSTYFQGHSSYITSVAFSPDSKYIISGSYDKTVKLWEVESERLVHTFKGHEHRVNSVAFSLDGRHIVSGSYDKTVKLWEAASGQLVHTFEGHNDSVSSVAFSPDGKYIVSGSYDETVKLWKV